MKCKCGHLAALHVLLPGHPDGVQECQSEDCECGKYRPKSEGCNHLYRVTSPIDSVEICQFCGDSRPCDLFVGEHPDRPLGKDQA